MPKHLHQPVTRAKDQEVGIVVHFLVQVVENADIQDAKNGGIKDLDLQNLKDDRDPGQGLEDRGTMAGPMKKLL